MKRLSKEKLIEDLKELAKNLGKTPTSWEMSHYHRETGRGAAHASYCDYFGNWLGALEAAGLDTSRCLHHISDEELCVKLCDLAKELGHAPLRKEVDAHREKMPCSQTYIVRFGSWKKAVTAAGLSMNYHFRENYSDDDLLEMLCRLAEELGRKPTVRDLDSYEWAPCYATVTNHFGTWNEALKRAGLLKKRRKPRRLSEAEKYERKKMRVIRQLEAFVKREGRVPVPDDLGKKSKTPCYRTCVSYLGNWQDITASLGKII